MTSDFILKRLIELSNDNKKFKEFNKINNLAVTSIAIDKPIGGVIFPGVFEVETKHYTFIVEIFDTFAGGCHVHINLTNTVFYDFDDNVSDITLNCLYEYECDFFEENTEANADLVIASFLPTNYVCSDLDYRIKNMLKKVKKASEWFNESDEDKFVMLEMFKNLCPDIKYI